MWGKWPLEGNEMYLFVTR